MVDEHVEELLTLAFSRLEAPVRIRPGRVKILCVIHPLEFIEQPLICHKTTWEGVKYDSIEANTTPTLLEFLIMVSIVELELNNRYIRVFWGGGRGRGPCIYWPH